MNCIKLSRLNVPPALLDKKERDGPLPLVEWEGYSTFVKNSNNCGDNIFEGCISIAPKEILSKLLTAESDTNILSYLKILATLRYDGEHDERIPKSKKRAYQEIEFKRDIKWERPSGKELVLGMIKGKISSQFQYLVSIKHIDLTSAGFQKTNANLELREGGLQEIGSSTFFCCTGLQVIYLPISLRRIGEQAFGGCENLQEVCVKEVRSHDQSRSEATRLGIRQLSAMSIKLRTCNKLMRRLRDDALASLTASHTDRKTPQGTRAHREGSVH